VLRCRGGGTARHEIQAETVHPNAAPFGKRGNEGDLGIKHRSPEGMGFWEGGSDERTASRRRGMDIEGEQIGKFGMKRWRIEEAPVKAPDEVWQSPEPLNLQHLQR